MPVVQFSKIAVVCEMYGYWQSANLGTVEEYANEQ